MKRASWILLAGLVAACTAPGRTSAPARSAAGPPHPEDPRDGDVPLPASAGWNASLVIDNGKTGIWTVGSFPIFETLGCPQVVGLDDQGRCWVLASYSGRWTPMTIIHDRRWLGGLAHADVDPRLPGRELYTGGQRGNLFQVGAYPQGSLDCRLIAHFPGREIHTIVAGELDPASPGKELLVFTRPGGLFRVTPTGADGTFRSERIADVPGRVRDALVLPAAPGAVPEIATVSRAGQLRL
ncbi:MAG: hypothetical protein ACE5JG_12975, partial [Planctomycetota bacterium]